MSCRKGGRDGDCDAVMANIFGLITQELLSNSVARSGQVRI